MKKTHLILVIIAIFALLSMTKTEKIKSKDIIKSYPLFIKAKVRVWKGEKYATLQLDSLRQDHFVQDLVNENWAIFDYLFVNSSQIAQTREIDKFIGNEKKLKHYVYKSLSKDELFNKNILQLSYNFLKKKNILISGFEPMEVAKISLDSITNIVSRFFHLKRIDKNGDPRFTVCVGNHGCSKDYTKEMLPIIEAFCFQVIYNAGDDIWNDFNNAKKEILEIKEEVTEIKIGRSEIKMPIKKKDIYLRNLMYNKMTCSKNLQAFILEEYNKKKDILNFVIEE